MKIFLDIDISEECLKKLFIKSNTLEGTLKLNEAEYKLLCEETIAYTVTSALIAIFGSAQVSIQEENK